MLEEGEAKGKKRKKEEAKTSEEELEVTRANRGGKGGGREVEKTGIRFILEACRRDCGSFSNPGSPYPLAEGEAQSMSEIARGGRRLGRSKVG